MLVLALADVAPHRFFARVARAEEDLRVGALLPHVLGQSAPVGLNGQALWAIERSAIGGHFWAVGVSWFFGGPAILHRLSPAGPVAARVEVAPTPPDAAALAVEDARTVGVLVGGATRVTFLRVRDDVVVQRLELPFARSAEGVSLRFVGGRYVAGWGTFLDELVPCAGAT